MHGYYGWSISLPVALPVPTVVMMILMSSPSWPCVSNVIEPTNGPSFSRTESDVVENRNNAAEKLLNFWI